MNWLSKEEELKQILEDKEFAFNANHWEAAERMLLLKKKRKQRKRLLFFVVVPSILLGGVLWALFPHANTATTTTYKQEQEQHSNEKSKSLPYNTDGAGNDNNNALSQDNPANSIEEQTTTPTAQYNQNTQNVQNSPNTQRQGTQTGIDNGLTNTGGANGEGNRLTNEGGSINDGDNNQPQQNTTTGVVTDGATTVETETTVTALPQEKGDSIEEPLTVNATVAKDSAETVAKKKPDRDKREVYVHPLRHQISVNAGITYSKLLKVRQNHLSILPYAAINYNCRLPSKWQLGAGIAYSATNSSGLFKKYEVSEHSFGQTQTKLTIHTNKLHYFEIPVFARYTHNNRWFFSGGINTSYLISVSGNVDETSTGIFAQGNKYPGKANSYLEGLSTWDMQLLTGVEWLYKKNLYMGGVINTGLTDIGKNGYYGNNVFERNMRLQLYLRYELWNF